LLAEAFMKEVCNDYGMQQKKISQAAMKELQKVSWTGNVRELRNVVERLAILGEKEITAEDVKKYAAK
jgi:DNA-binding NtrC family response regulator